MRLSSSYKAVLRQLSAGRLAITLAAGLAAVTLLLAWRGIERTGDVALYARYASEIFKGQTPYKDFLLEYPPLALIPILAAGLFSPSGGNGYLLAFLVENAALAVILAGVLWRLLALELSSARARRGLAVFVALVGVLSFLFLRRYDFFPALLTALSVASFARGKPGQAGLWAGLGIATKLYPIFLVAVLVGHLGVSRRFAGLVRLLGGCGVSLLAVFLPFALLTGGKVFQFLEYHKLRGLQIESLPSGLILLGHGLSWTRVELRFNFGAHHLASPWADRIQPWMPMLTVFLVGLATLRAWSFLAGEYRQEGRVHLRTTAALAFFVILVSLISSKVLSPQYLAWLLPLAPFLRFRQAALFAAICGMTSVLLLGCYRRLLNLDLVSILVLNLRNALLVGLAVWMAWSGPRARLNLDGTSR